MRVGGSGLTPGTTEAKEKKVGTVLEGRAEAKHAGGVSASRNSVLHRWVLYQLRRERLSRNWGRTSGGGNQGAADCSFWDESTDGARPLPDFEERANGNEFRFFKEGASCLRRMIID